MKIVFAGTPEFSVPTLQALINSEHEVIAVYTQPDRPAGRGRKLTASPVKHVALENQIPVYQPKTLRDAEVQKQFAKLQPDVMVVIAYGLILPRAVLEIPKLGCINVHASLLPRWRGAAPIQHAIIAGDKETGITIMQMAEGLDTGDMLLKESCVIQPDDTSQDLYDKLGELGAQALIKTLEQIDKLNPVKQEDAHATHAPKIKKEEAVLDWNLSAQEIVRHIHGYNPWPGVVTTFKGEPLKIWQAEVLHHSVSGTPGEVVSIDEHMIDVVTGEGLVRLLTVQLPGGKRISAQDFINSHQGEIKKFG